MRQIITLSLLFVVSLFYSQNKDWIKIDDFLSYQNIYENSSNTLQNDSPISLTIYEIGENEDLKISSKTKYILNDYKINFGNFKEKVLKTDFPLKTDSEYYFKFENSNKIPQYQIVFLGKNSETEKKQFIDFLNSTYEIVTSKNETTEIDNEATTTSLKIQTKKEVSKSELKTKFPNVEFDFKILNPDLSVKIILVRS